MPNTNLLNKLETILGSKEEILTLQKNFAHIYVNHLERIKDIPYNDGIRDNFTHAYEQINRILDIVQT